MIRGRMANFERRVHERGYTMASVQPCIVSVDGEFVTVDETHNAYPHASRCRVGSELKALLRRIGITAKPGCLCNRRAESMDKNGCDWCEEHIGEIVGWLREEAQKRSLPFLDAAGRLLVRRAIANARRKATV